MRYVPFELSLAFEQSCAESREAVQHQLEVWGGARYNDWPVRAQCKWIGTSSSFDTVVRAAQRGIAHSVQGHLIPLDNYEADEWYRVFFCEPQAGTKVINKGPALTAFIESYDDWETYHLGCPHLKMRSVQVRPQLSRLTCQCGHTYEIDTSD